MYGLDRCAVLVLKQRVKVRCKGIVLPNGQMMGEVDKGMVISISVFCKVRTLCKRSEREDPNWMFKKSELMFNIYLT
jgi:hypothetical protein